MAVTIATTKAPSLDDPNDPWVIARNRFTADLSEGDKKIFESASLENLYYTTSNYEREDRSSSKARSLFQKMRPLVLAVEDYGQALDTFTNIAPLYLAPIWGSIRVFLAIAKKYTKFYVQVIEMFGRIGDLLPRFRDYQRLFDSKKHQRLTQALANTYLDIITLCTDFRNLLQEQKTSALRRILKPVELSTELDDAIQRFRDHKETVEKEAEICHMIEAQEARAIILANKELQEREQKANRRFQLLGLLSGADDSYRHRALVSMHHAGTCSWALETREYQDWLSCRESALLCCYGIPGCGKSVLASTIIDTLPKPTEVYAVTHYYCDHADKRTLEPTNIFASLARGLLQHIPIPSSVENLIMKCYCHGENAPELGQILEIIKALIEEVFESVTVVLDGLDEVKDSDRQNINQALKSLWTVSKPIKLLVCSRDDDVTAMKPPDVVKYSLQVLPTAIDNDIKLFVTHSVRDLLADGSLVVGNESLEQLIIDCLVDGAKGMFLWVRFQLDELCTAETDRELHRVLENLPKDLGETYDRLLGRIHGQQREELVRRMFQWIISAKRPLYIDELREGIAFNIEDRCWDSSKIPNQILRLVRACGNLIMINEETRHVSLAHYTVEQYILSKAYDLGSPIHFTREEANIAVAQVCIGYLCFSDFESQVSKFLDNTNVDMMKIQEMVTSHSVVPNHYLLHSVVSAWDYFRGGPSAKPKPFDFRRHIKTRGPSESLLQKFRLLDYISENWLLHTASLDQHMDRESRAFQLFQKLILHEKLLFNVLPWNQKGIQDSEILLIAQVGWAVESQHLLLLAVLSDANPNVYLMYRAGVVLHSLGPSLYKLVLDKRLLELLSSHSETIPENVERAYLWLYSKVISACRQGSLLTELKSGLLSVEGATSSGHSTSSARELGTMIQSHLLLEASIHGHVKLVENILDSVSPLQLMLEYDGCYLSALELAALHGHVGMVARLRPLFVNGLFSRVDPHSWEYLGNALINAAWDTNAAVVEGILMVMESSPVLHEEDNPQCSALRKAAQKGDLRIVQLLLKYGANPLAVGPEGDSSFEIGIRSGNVKIVREMIRRINILVPGYLSLPKSIRFSLPDSSSKFAPSGLTKHEIDLLQDYPQRAVSIGRQRIDSNVNSYLRLAISLGYTEIAIMLVGDGNWTKLLKHKSLLLSGPTLLFIAVANGHIQTVKHLLENGADVHEESEPAGDLLQSNSRGAAYFPHLRTPKDWKRTPLWAAAVCSYDDIVSLLLSSSKNFKLSLSLDECPLYQAAKIGNLTVIRLLLEAGIDPRASLLAHVKFGDDKITRRIVEAHLHLTPGEPWGSHDTNAARVNYYPIKIATMCGRSEIVRYLLLAGAKTADREPDEMSALLWAIKYDHDDIVQMLLEHRALFKADDRQRVRALDMACRKPREHIALLLLARHSREWSETTEGRIFKQNTLKEIEELGPEVLNSKVYLEIRRIRNEVAPWARLDQ